MQKEKFGNTPEEIEAEWRAELNDRIKELQAVIDGRSLNTAELQSVIERIEDLLIELKEEGGDSKNILK